MRRCDPKPVRHDDQLPLLPKLERDVERRGAGVEGNGLAVDDHLGGGAGDRPLSLLFDAKANVERDLGLPALQRPGASADTHDEPLAREHRQVTPDGHLGDREPLRKLGDADRVTRLEQLEHATHPLVRGGSGRCRTVVHADAQRLPSWPISEGANLRWLSLSVKKSSKVLLSKADSAASKLPQSSQRKRRGAMRDHEA